MLPYELYELVPLEVVGIEIVLVEVGVGEAIGVEPNIALED